METVLRAISNQFGFIQRLYKSLKVIYSEKANSGIVI